jgi:hypothetical protein
MEVIICYMYLLTVGMVHAWVGQKPIKSNIFMSFINCHKVVIESLFT